MTHNVYEFAAAVERSVREQEQAIRAEHGPDTALDGKALDFEAQLLDLLCHRGVNVEDVDHRAVALAVADAMATFAAHHTALGYPPPAEALCGGLSRAIVNRANR